MSFGAVVDTSAPGLTPHSGICYDSKFTNPIFVMVMGHFLDFGLNCHLVVNSRWSYFLLLVRILVITDPLRCYSGVMDTKAVAKLKEQCLVLDQLEECWIVMMVLLGNGYSLIRAAD